MTATTVIAHISDLHLDGGRRAADRAKKVLHYLRDLPRQVDVLVVTGDLTDAGLAAEYEEAVAVLASRTPTLLCPGNHDARDHAARDRFRAALTAVGGGRRPGGAVAMHGPVNQVREVAGVVFALCDSTVPGRDDGLLTAGTLAWLDETLSQVPSGAPAFVCCHHPPVELHHDDLDTVRQFGAERLAEVVERHPQVVAVLCGHAHTAAVSTFAGRPLLVAPAVATTLRLPWEGCGVLDKAWPPAIAYHVLDHQHRLTTHFRTVT